VFVANTRALALSASVFREVVYDFRESALVAHALRTSTSRIVECMMRATGGLNIARNTEDRRPGRGNEAHPEQGKSWATNPALVFHPHGRVKRKK
jgi:hypothetical protein